MSVFRLSAIHTFDAIPEDMNTQVSGLLGHSLHPNLFEPRDGTTDLALGYSVSIGILHSRLSAINSHSVRFILLCYCCLELTKL